jgi:hypothetical protein
MRMVSEKFKASNNLYKNKEYIDNCSNLSQSTNETLK